MEVCLSYLGGYEKKSQWDDNGEFDAPYLVYIKNKMAEENQSKSRYRSFHIRTLTTFLSNILLIAFQKIPQFRQIAMFPFDTGMKAFDQHPNFYEDEQDLLTRQMMKRALRKYG